MRDMDVINPIGNFLVEEQTEKKMTKRQAITVYQIIFIAIYFYAKGSLSR